MCILICSRSKKGQALIEAVLVVNIMIIMFLGMIYFAVYVYDKMIVAFAANIMIDEAIGKIPDKNIAGKPNGNRVLEGMMRNVGRSILQYGIYLDYDAPYARVEKPPRDPTKGYISAEVTAKYRLHMPVISKLTKEVTTIKYASKVHYAW